MYPTAGVAHAVFDSPVNAGRTTLRFYFPQEVYTGKQIMKIPLNKADVEELETRNFVKFRGKTHKLRGTQSVTQLVSRVENYADPDAKFENSDLNELSRMGFLDELISGIKTGKEASVFLGKNRRIRPMAFSTPPFCQGACGSQK